MIFEQECELLLYVNGIQAVLLYHVEGISCITGVVLLVQLLGPELLHELTEL